MEAGLQSCRAGMASSSKLSGRLFAAAERVWEGRSPFGAEMAAEIQFSRTSELAWPCLRRRSASSPWNSHTGLFRTVGERSISTPLRRVRTRPISVAHARVVLGEPGLGGNRCVWDLLASLAFLFASTGDFGGHSNRKCLRERGGEPVCRCGFSAPAKSFDRTLAHASAGGAALWAAQAWPQHLAKPRSGWLRNTCAAQYGHLDGTVASSSSEVGKH